MSFEPDELRGRVSRVLKCFISTRSASDPQGMQNMVICERVRFSPPTLKKLLHGDAGKVEHLFALVKYLGVPNFEIMEIAETYVSTQDMNFKVSALIQRRFNSPQSRSMNVQSKSA
ncbi:hypothetical protein [Asticcacaulis excentricus]|uniref:hypothetical protein n=1 Tax=Asticcacaulis excentricus TaxID=78587 RepID=UPI0011803A53|nr:hypothetical protein [Asticcacaulis excentricus]